MNRRTEERLRELNEVYQNEVASLISANEESQPSLDTNGEIRPSFGEPTEGRPVEVRNMTISAYEINISQVHNGFIVRVGCQTFVFETFETVSKYLTDYFQNPIEMEIKFSRGELFS